LADAREGFEELGLEAQLLVEPSVVNDLGADRQGPPAIPDRPL